jgi:nitrogen regulatory protein PII
VVLFLIEASLVQPVLDEIYKAGRLKEAGTGIAFVIDVENVIGLESQLEHFKRTAASND